MAVFQPHRYSRVKQFTKQFAEELSKADVIYVTSIYGAGEKNEDKITSKIITDLIYKKNKNVSYINNYYEVAKNFYQLTQQDSCVDYFFLIKIFFLFYLNYFHLRSY